MNAGPAVSAGISRKEIEVLITRSASTDPANKAFFDDARTARGAVDVLIGTVRTAAKAVRDTTMGYGVATVLSLGCRVLEAIASLGADALKKLAALLTSAACHACGKKVQIEWAPVKGMSAYELRVIDHACV